MTMFSSARIVKQYWLMRKGMKEIEKDLFHNLKKKQAT